MCLNNFFGVSFDLVKPRIALHLMEGVVVSSAFNGRQLGTTAESIPQGPREGLWPQINLRLLMALTFTKCIILCTLCLFLKISV
jgi:hypothetical protein